MQKRKVRWANAAKAQYLVALEYIANDSIQSAEVFDIDLREKFERICDHPAMYPPDKYKINNDSSFRAFLLYRYIFSYRIMANEIRVLRVRHSSMKPQSY